MAYTPIRTALAASLLMLGTSAFAADTPATPETPATLSGASASMLANTCAGCHGTDGASTGPATPTIAGLSTEYFAEVMKQFASGDQKSTIMGRIAKGYSEDEIKAMADYYGAKPFVKAKQNFDQAMVDKGAKLHDKYCEKCHAEGGTSKEDDAGVMAGQWTPYLKWTLADFQAGDRPMPKKMKKKVEDMLEKEGDASIDALLNFWASQQ